MKKPICEIDKLGNKTYWRNNRLHREDGPAVEWARGGADWYRFGKFLGVEAGEFWALWNELPRKKRNNLNLHIWMNKYL